MAAPPPHKKPKMDDDGKIGKHQSIYIDRNGNLKLIIGPNAVQMQVDANALRRASKVFSRMLFGPFSESHQTENWTVELPEDDPEALRVIFHVVHGNLGNIPEKLTTPVLYDITVMADKYAMIGSLQPWGLNWTLPYLKSCEWNPEDKNETSYEDLQMLLVMYHLGPPPQFDEVLDTVLLKSKTDSDGRIRFKMTPGVDGVGSGSQYSQWDAVGPLPSNIIELIQSNRVELISRLLGNFESAYAYYTAMDNYATVERRCCSKALGLMTQHLVQESLWPLPDEDDVRLSVAELARVADKIREEIEEEVYNKCKCSPGKRGFTRCDIEVPNSHLSYGLPGDLLEYVTWDDFTEHFRTRKMATVCDD